jgi:hypothetical protein
MKNLTPSQAELFETIKLYMGKKLPVKYDILKSLCSCKSFDASFNAILRAGYITRHETNDFSNQFKLK